MQHVTTVCPYGLEKILVGSVTQFSGALSCKGKVAETLGFPHERFDPVPIPLASEAPPRWSHIHEARHRRRAGHLVQLGGGQAVIPQHPQRVERGRAGAETSEM